ncbi:AraC family transcriptional regulator [Labedella phragmitis]|uniref:AraC family transcriptional regulator n=1 Tax=Labedella phragmitis TaxID=2498849 RepID=A0A3S5CEL2_9MICO|nr:AraC family transcriptional regulator [Labedella phragmitis]RWZ51138.1 AraC family transcriptional regulator [Labedella phragmitis]
MTDTSSGFDELRTLIARHGTATPVAIGEAAVISRVEETGPPAFSTTGTVFVLMAQGEKRLAVGELVHVYGAEQSMIASVDLPITGHFTRASRREPALGFALTLRPALVAELLLHPAAGRLPRLSRGAPAPGITVGDPSVELVDAVLRMVRLIERPDDLAVLAPLVEREILWLLVRGPLGTAVRQLGLAESTVNRVGHAVQWIRDRYAEPLSIEELAEVAMMSPSAFHRSFQAVTAMSPIQFQKQLRLQEARVRLLADPRDVAGAAHAVGYESASQFSREYRRRFGASPLQDVAGLRQGAGAR